MPVIPQEKQADKPRRSPLVWLLAVFLPLLLAIGLIGILPAFGTRTARIGPIAVGVGTIEEDRLIEPPAFGFSFQRGPHGGVCSLRLGDWAWAIGFFWPPYPVRATGRGFYAWRGSYPPRRISERGFS
jgi:hypothetical protein